MSVELDQYVVGLLPRLVGCSTEAMNRLFAARDGLRDGRTMLDSLCDEGVISRVASRAIRMTMENRYDENDLKQLLQPSKVRSGIYRLAAAINDTVIGSSATIEPDLVPGKTIERESLLRLGDRLGKFEIRGFLGRGTSGCVYLANHASLGIPVALKALDPAGVPDRVLHAQQFRAEAAVLARLNHPNILRLYDFEEGDPPFMALEFIHGQSLQQTIQQEGVLAPQRAFSFVAQTTRALRAAHRAGVVHLDIKPANILVALDGTVKLADFGIARLRGQCPRVLRQDDPGQRLLQGTLAYMAPEQFTSVGDHRSDMYALGLVLYHALSGQPPILAGSWPEFAQRHQTYHPEPLDRSSTDIPSAVARLVERLIAKDPEQRPESYSEIFDALEMAFGLRLESI